MKRFLIIAIAMLFAACSAKAVPAAEASTPSPARTEAVRTPEAETVRFETPTPTPTPTPEPTPELITNERLDSGEFDSWFDDALFVGDSLTEVFSHRVRNVRNETGTEYLGKAKFLSAYSMSTKHVSENNTNGTVNFMYRGRKVTLAEGIHEIGPKKVFMLFGLNDLAVRNWDDVLGYFGKIIDQVCEKNPDVELIVQGVLPVRKTFYDKEPKWCDFNIGLKQLCEEKGVTFVSFAEELMDENGYLRADLAEGKCHLNIAGEDVWVRFLRRFAAQRMLGNVVFETP